MAGLRAICLLLFLSLASGCAPAVVGGGAAGAYKVGTDERTVGTMFDDAALTTRVKAALAREESVKARNIDVDTVEGMVVLSGFVDSSRELNRAAEIARAEAGVVHVRNELRVGTRSMGQTIDDKTLGARIKAKLVQEPGIRSLNIDVDVYLGTVYLSGVVRSREQQAQVSAIVRSESGVADIVDNLLIR
jgi:hyperosmotically inducible protein